MNIKNFRKFVGIPFCLLIFVATLAFPLLSYSSAGATIVGPPSSTGDSSVVGTGNAQWSSRTSIVTASGETFKQTSTTGGNMALTGSQCAAGYIGNGPTVAPGSTLNFYTDIISIGSGPSADTAPGYKLASDATITTYTKGYTTKPNLPSTTEVSTCHKNNPTKIFIAQTWYGLYTLGDTPATTATGTATQGDCPINDGSSLQWVLCPVFLLGSQAIQAMNKIIAGFLYTPTDQIFTNQFEGAFNKFRDIGVALLVIAAMVMVISQAAGLEIFAAYTVRKALPRIVIAAIGMALAWPLLDFVVTFFNDIGGWAGQLILAATNVSGSGSNFDVGTAVGAGVEAFFGASGVVVAVAALGWMWLLSMLFTIFLAILIGILVLSLRQLVILVCILIAPLAIAASILPGTQKLWTFWKDTLLTTLLMFPIIMAFLASGVALSHIIGAENSAVSTQLLSLLVYFAPYFMLPFAFKLAGGLMSTAYSAINGAHQGVFASLKKGRANMRAQRYEAAKSGNLFKGKNPVSTGLSAAAWGATNLSKAGADPRRWKSRMHEARTSSSTAIAGELLEKSPELRAIFGDNAAIAATKMLADGKSDADVRGKIGAEYRLEGAELNSVMSRALMAQQAGPNQAVKIAADFAGAQSGTQWMDNVYKEDTTDEDGTVHKKGDNIKGTAFQKMAQSIADTSRGDAALEARMWNQMKSDSMRAGRVDLGGSSWKTGYDQIRQVSAGHTGTDKYGVADTSKVLLSAFEDSSASTVLGGKSYSTDAIIEAASKKMINLSTSKNPDDKDAAEKMANQYAQLAAGMVNAQRSGMYVSPHAAITVQQTIEAAPQDVRVKIAEVQQRMGRPMGEEMPPDKVQPPAPEEERK